MTTKEQLDWCDRVGEYFSTNAGLPSITGRTMAWLMICEPSEQSPADISAALSVSRASLTTSLGTLTASGLVRRISRPGSRARYYRSVEEAWSVALRQRLQSIGAFVALVEAGQRLSVSGNTRLRAVEDVYRWFAEEIEPLWQRWEELRSLAHRSTAVGDREERA